MSWAPTHMRQLRIRRGIPALEVPTEERGAPSQRSASRPGVPVPGREVPTEAGCENQQGSVLVTRVLLEGQVGPLRGSVHRPLSSREGAAVQKVPGTYRDKLNCLASGQGLEGPLSQG